MHRCCFVVFAACGFSNEIVAAEKEPSVDAANGPSFVVELPAIGDTFLRQQYPTQSHGDFYYHRCGSGDPANCCTNRALYRFDVTALPPCAIVKAELRAFYFDEDYDDAHTTFVAHRVTSEWTEADATWMARTGASAWTTPGGDFEPTPLASIVARSEAYGWLAWDITRPARDWRAGAPNHGVIVVEPNDLAGAERGRKFLYARDTSRRDLRPHLRVECATP